MDKKLIKHLEKIFPRFRDLSIKYTRQRVSNLKKCTLAKNKKLIKLTSYPTIVTIEPTNYCTLKCALCRVGKGVLKRPKNFIDFKLYKKIVDEVAPHIFYIQLHHGGEPLLHPKIAQLISYAHKKGLGTLLSSNMNVLPDNPETLIKSGLDLLIVSLDGATKETYEKYRIGGDFNKVINNIKELIELKRKFGRRKPIIKIQFIIMSHNESEINVIQNIAKKVMVNEVIYKTVYLCDDTEKQFLPKDKRYSCYSGRKVKGILERIEPINNWCDALWDEGIICSDGSVSLCCRDYDAEFNLGNLNKSKFIDIWNGRKYQSLRKQIMENKMKIKQCRNCPGTRVKTFIKIN